MENGVSQQDAHTVDDPPPLPKIGAYESMLAPFPDPPALFPQVGAEGGWLRRHGTAMLLDNTNEFMGAVTPPTRGVAGLRQGASNAGQYALSITTDWGRVTGWRGLTTRVVTIGRYGTTANRMFGDWLAHSSEIYGGGGNVVVHLVMAYAEQHLLGGYVSVAAGRMAQLSDFGTGAVFCNFLNNSFCGRPKAIADSSYYSSYPASVWAFRVRARPVRQVYVQAGIYFAEEGIFQNPQHRSGFKLNGGNIVGEIFPVEAGWEPKFGAWRRLPGHYKVGAAVENVGRATNYTDSHGNPYATSGFSPARKTGAWSAYLLADQRVFVHRFKDRNDTGTTVLAGAVFNDPDTALRDREFYAGVVDRGFWHARPLDTIGVAFSTVHIARGVQRTEELYRAQGRALPQRASGIQRHEEIIEANYALPIGRAAIFQPDVQYYIRPNGQGNLRNALMLGFRAHVEVF